MENPFKEPQQLQNNDPAYIRETREARKKRVRKGRKNNKRPRKNANRRPRKKGRKNRQKKRKSKQNRSGKNNQLISMKKDTRIKCDDCAMKLAQYTKLYVAQAQNRKKQIKRMKSFQNLMGKKISKNGVFKTSLEYAKENTGNDISNPKCKGKPLSRIEKNSTTTDLLTLSSCEKDIPAQCEIKTAFSADENINTCQTAMEDYVVAFSSCIEKTGEPEICGCLDKINTTLIKIIKSCKVDQTLKQALKDKNKCTAGNFCKKKSFRFL